MNRKYKKDSLKTAQLPKEIDSFSKGKDWSCLIEYDGWHFEAATIKGAINQVLKYIFDGGEK